MLNHSDSFLGSMRNLSSLGGELKIFTDVELDTLEKLINSTEVCEAIRNPLRN